jgi:alpha-glucosidase
MLHLYREALALRRRLPSLASNEFRWLQTEPGVLAFTRGDGFGCVVNCSSRVVSAPVDGELLLASHQEGEDKLPPNSAAWYALAPAAAALGEAA